MTSIVLVDDHILLRNGLSALVKSLGYLVLFEADNGADFCKKLNEKKLPDIVLLDINMPQMDGYETCKWLRTHHPSVKVLALSMYDDDFAVITMLKNGARGYILKDSDPLQLKSALDEIEKKGHYYSELVNGKMLHAINNDSLTSSVSLLNEKEKEFLRLNCSELTYKGIAEIMGVSHRTVDGYRDTLFEKLQVKNRVGLALYAIKNGIVDVYKT